MKTTSLTAPTGAARLRTGTLAFSSVLTRLTDSRTKTGEATIECLDRAAKLFGDEDVPASWFVTSIFTGDDTEAVKARSAKTIIDHPLDNGHLTRHEVMAYADEWDGWGPSDLTSFVDALACNTLGSNRGNAVADILNLMSFSHSSEDGHGGENMDTDFASGYKTSLIWAGGLCDKEALDRAGW
jgi:hypothetical protein